MMIKGVGAILIGCAAIGATVYSGVMHGRIRHEFGLGDDLSQEVRIVESLPDKIGETENGLPAWVRDGEPSRLDDEVADLLECQGHYQATYQSTKNPDLKVSLLVLVGPSGPLLVHAPEVCYPAGGHQYMSGPNRLLVSPKSGSTGELQVMMFKRSKVEGGKVRVGYAFTADGHWESPKNARRYFAGAPFLYKFQLHTVLPSDYEITDDTDPIKRFAEDFFPAFQEHIKSQ